MADTYKVTRVSEQEPREWTGEHGTVYYIKVMVDGHDKPIEVGKKSPDAIKVGDELYGTITPTQYQTDKFKAEKKPFGGGKSYQPRDDDSIKAQFAIKTAARMAPSFVEKTGDLEAWIEIEAKKLFAMVDRVKGSEQSKPSLSEQWKEKQAAKNDAVSNEEVDSLLASGEPIDLKDIPLGF